MSATEVFQELVAAHASAVNDPRRISRWRWVRTRAERDLNDLADALMHRSMRNELQLIDEAVERARNTLAGDPEVPQWRAPFLKDVRFLLDDLGHSFSPPDSTIAERLFSEALYGIDKLHLRTAEASAAHMPLHVYENAIGLADFATRPHRDFFFGPTPRAEKLARFITSGICITDQPITVWRGEHPSDRAPNFAHSTLNARIGDTIRRTPTPLSATLDPGVAANIELSGASAVGADTVSSGWILKIETDELLYAGSRETLLERRDGLADEEKEALIVTPALQVTNIFEGAINAHWGLKRARIIECITLR